MGDRKRPALAEQIDRPRAPQQFVARSRSARATVSRSRASEAAAEFGEAAEQAGRIAAVARAGVQRLHPFGIIGPAIAQVRAEDALQFREAAKADRLGEADQRRGLHLGARGDAGGGAQRHLLRVFQREGGDLLQTLGQIGFDPDQPAFKSSKFGFGLPMSLPSAGPAGA